MNRNASKSIAMTLMIALITCDAVAQVTTGTSATSWLGNKANLFYGLIATVSAVFMLAAWVAAGLKMAYDPNARLTDLKGLLIGGLVCGGAAVFSYSLLN